MKKIHILAFLLVLILSLSKYFYQFEKRAMFEFDHEYLSTQSKMILIDKKLSLIGAPTSVGGIFIGPGYNYFMALAHWLGKMSPYTVDLIANAWAVISLLAIFYIAKRLFNYQTALFSFLVSLASFAFLKNESLPPLLFPLPLISLLIFYLLARKKINWLFIAFLVGCSFHLHFTAIFFLPMILMALVWIKPKVEAKSLLWSLLILLFFLSPLIFFELRHNFFISKNFVDFIFQNKLGSFNWPAQLIRSFQISFQNLGNLLWPGKLVFLQMLIIFIALFRLEKKLRQLVLIWIFAPIVFFSLYKGHIINYYYVLQEPIFFLLLGTTLGFLWQGMMGKILVTACLAIIFFVNFQNWYSWRSRHALYYKIKVFNFIKEKTDDRPFYLSFTVEPSWMGGYQYLTYYYDFNLVPKPDPDYPTITLIQPNNWYDIKSDYVFGEIGVGLP